MPYAINQGVRIRYEVEGTGSPLVLHIGFFGALEDWYDGGYVAALKGDYRLILLDPRGQGDSDKPHDPAAYAWRVRVGDVLAVLDAEGIERAHFWGYSMGGRVGFALGAGTQERVTSLIIGGADPSPVGDRPWEEDQLIADLRRGMPALVADWEAGDPLFWVSAGERARWLAADAEALIAARRAALAEPGLDDALTGIRVPALLYVGSLDDPDRVARAARQMPDATFVALDGLDHAQANNRSDLVVPHVRSFLRQMGGSQRA